MSTHRHLSPRSLLGRDEPRPPVHPDRLLALLLSLPAPQDKTETETGCVGVVRVRRCLGHVWKGCVSDANKEVVRRCPGALPALLQGVRWLMARLRDTTQPQHQHCCASHLHTALVYALAALWSLCGGYRCTRAHTHTHSHPPVCRPTDVSVMWCAQCGTSACG